MRTRIAALVKSRVGVADRLARTRRLMLDELTVTAQRARDSGAGAMHLSMEILPGVPFPAALIAADRAWASAPANRDDVGVALTASVPGATLAENRNGTHGRRVEAGLSRIGDTQSPSLSAEYWLPYPDLRGMLNLTFSAPMAREPELYAALFDAIVDSLTWKI
jgi:hypothetical protein